MQNRTHRTSSLLAAGLLAWGVMPGVTDLPVRTQRVRKASRPLQGPWRRGRRFSRGKGNQHTPVNFGKRCVR